jgi:hypothetical protein
MAEMRPRHYAADICQIKDRAGRRAALEKVPEHLRAMVMSHVQVAFAKAR